ncbi:hypothetical protein SY2F82_57780 [Streptomyces sp. Y2F8-2]|nr:hypothetical protein SY2F82_57780 [Streptomyces sp. Y2F8-2]
METVAARHGVVAAAGVAPDPAAEGGDRLGGRECGQGMGGHVSPGVLGREGAGAVARGQAALPCSNGANGAGRRGAARLGRFQRRRLLALQTRSRSMWRREVSRRDCRRVRRTRLMTGLRRPIVSLPVH